MTLRRSSLETVLKNARINSSPSAVGTLSRVSPDAEIADEGSGKLRTFEPSPSFSDSKPFESKSFVSMSDCPLGDMMAKREDLNMLRRLIDSALQLALELDETMTAHILSIARREVSE